MSIAVCGSIGIDTIENKYGKFDNILGGSATYFAFSASFFTKVYIFACVGKDFDFNYLEMFKTKENINTKYIKLSEKYKNFRWHGRYSADFESVETIYGEYEILSENVLDQEITDRFDIIFLANTSPQIQYEMWQFFQDTPFIFCDTMKHWITTDRKKLEELLSRVYGIFLNQEEAKLLSGEASTVEACKKIKKYGVKVVVVKKGEDGVLVNFDNNIVAYSGYPSSNILDTTGAGDAFAGAFLGFIDIHKCEMTPEIIKKASIWGNVLASLACEGIGPEKLLKITKRDIDRRFQEYLEIMRI